MNLWTKAARILSKFGFNDRRSKARHGDDLIPDLFIRALEDRYVPSASSLGLHNSLDQLLAATHQSPTAATTASVIISRSSGSDALSVSVNGQTLSSDSASQLAQLVGSGNNATIEVGGLLASQATNLTVIGQSSDTVQLLGPLNLDGGKLNVSAGKIEMLGSVQTVGGAVDLDAGLTGSLLVQGNISVANSAPGGLGGTIQLLGSQITIGGNSQIDASGDSGGGTILVGGDQHGSNPAVRDADYVNVDSSVSLVASALSRGSGGKIVVWSNQLTQFAGNVQAEGGQLSGDGGQVEVSGKDDLLFQGSADLQAAHGATGTLLLDPSTITVVASGGADNSKFNSGVILASDHGNSTYTIDASAIVTLLGTTNVSMAASTEIDVNAAINVTTATSNTLTLDAPTIKLAANITTDGQAITLESTAGGGSGVVLAASSITLSTAPTASSAGAAILINDPVSGTSAGGQSLALDSGSSTAEIKGAVGASSVPLGTLTLQDLPAVPTTAGNILIDSGLFATSIVTGAAGYSVTIDGGGEISSASGTTFNNTGGLALGLSASDQIIFDNGLNGGSNAVTLEGKVLSDGANITFGGAATLASAVTVNTTNSSPSTAGNIEFKSTIGGAEALTLTAGTGTIALDNSVGSTTTPIAGLTINSASQTTTFDITSSQAISLTGSGNTEFKGAVATAAGGITVSDVGSTVAFDSTATATAGPISVSGSAVTFGGAVNATAGNVTLTNTGLLTMASVTAGGAFSEVGAGGTVSAAGTVTTTNSGTISFLNALTLTGALTLDTTNAGVKTGGNITLHSTVAGAGESLSLQAGAGAVSVSGAVGAGAGNTLGTVSLVSGGSFTFNGALNAATLSVPATAGSASVSLLAGGSISNAVTFNNTGALTLTGGASGFVFGGALDSGTSSTVNLSGTIDSQAQAITFEQAVVLQGDTVIDTTNGGTSADAAGAAIAFGSTINSSASGASSLELNAGTSGTVTVTGAVGAGHPLNNITIDDAAGVTTAAIHAATLTQTLGTGTTDFGGAIALAGSSGTNNYEMNVTGATVTFGGAVAAAAGGALIDSTGPLTMGSMALDGVFLQEGGGAVSAGGTVSTNDFAATFNSAVTLTSDLTVNTTKTGNAALGALITFGATVDSGAGGPFSLTLDAGNAAIALGGDLGDTSPLNAVTFGSSSGVTAKAVNAASLTQTAGTGTTQFQGAIAVSGSSPTAISLTGTAFQFDSIVTAAAGGMSINNSGQVTVKNSITLGGPFLQTDGAGTGAVTVQGTITTAGKSIGLADAVTLSGDLSVDSTNGGTAAGGAITFGSTIDGAHNLTLQSGSAETIVQGVVGGGTPLTSINLQSASQFDFVAAVNAASLNVTPANGSTFALTLGGGGAIQNTVAFNNGGALTLTGTLTLVGGGDASGDSVSLAGKIITDSSSITLGATTLIGSETIDTTQGGGGGSGIDFASTIDGASALTLNAGTAGTVNVTGAIGAAIPLGAIVIQNASGVTTQAISAATLTQSAGSGTSDFGGAITLSGASGPNNLALNITGGVVTFGGLVTATAGGATIDNTGALVMGSMSLDGAFLQQNSSAVTAGGALTTNGHAATFTSAVTLAASLAVDTRVTSNSSGGAAIEFDGAIDSAAGTPLNLTLNAGTGTITLKSDVGDNSPLAVVDLGSSAGATTQAINAAALTQDAGTGNTDFKGAINISGASGIALTGAGFEFDNTVNAVAGGMTINNSGAVIITNNVAVNGAFLQNDTQGTGTVSAAGTLTTSGNAITISDPLALQGSLVLDSTGGVFGGGAIQLKSTVSGAGMNLTLASGGAATTVSGDVGDAASLGTVTLTSGSAVTFSGALNAATLSMNGSIGNIVVGGGSITNAVNFNNSGTVTLGSSAASQLALLGGFTTLNNLFLAGTIRTAGQPISFQQPLSATLNASTTLDTTDNGNHAAGANIALASFNPNGHDLKLNAGTGGTISSLSGANFGNLEFVNSAGATVGAISAVSITQDNGSGTTIFQGTITVSSSSASAISLTGAGFEFDGAVTASAGGLAISNSGLVTITNNISLAGPLVQTNVGGTGTVTAQGTISTTGQSISFNSPLTMSANLSLDMTAGNSSTAGKAIALNGVVSGAFNLRLNAGSGGTISMAGTSAASAPIAITFVNSAGVTVSGSLTAGGIKQLAGSGTTDFQGALTTGAAGIDLTGSTIQFDAAIVTTGGGNVTVNDSTALTIGNATITGSFQQTGAGATTAHGTLATSGQTITLSSPVAMSGDWSLDTTNGNSNAAGNNIALDGTVNGNFNLTLNAGSGGTITMAGTSATAPNSVTFQNSAGVTVTGGLTAGAIVQSRGSGTTDFQGAVTAGAAGINLTGSSIKFDSALVTTGGGNVVVNDSASLTIGNASIDGSFLQSGAGSTTSQGTMTTSGQSVTFTSAVSMAGGWSVDTTNAGSNSQGAKIEFDSTIDGAQSLTLNAGSSGHATFNGAIGSSTPLTALNLTNAASFTFNGAVTTTALNAATGTYSIAFSNNVAVTAPVALANSGGLTLGSQSTDSFTFTGGLDTGTNSVSLEGSVLTSDAPITMKNLALTGNATLSSVNGAAGGAITVSGNVVGNGFNLTVQAGSGSSALGGVNGAGTLELASASSFAFSGPVNVQTLLVDASAASVALDNGGTIQNQVTFNNTGGVTLGNNQTSALTFVGGFNTGTNDVSMGGSIVTDGGAMQVNTPTLLAATTLDATGGGTSGGNIGVSGVIGGGFDLSLNAGTTGSIALSGASFGKVTLTNSASATIGTISATSITQVAGQGLTDFQGTVSTTGAGGITVHDAAVTFEMPVTTTGGGQVAVTHSGTLTMGAMSLDGAFSESGGGGVNASGTLSTSGNTITFNDSLALGGALTLDTTQTAAPTGANIVLQAVTSVASQALTLNAGTAGTIDLAGPLGTSAAPLGAVTIVNSKGLTAQSINAASLTQSAGAGTADFQGPISVTGPAGVNVTGATIDFEKMVAASAGGATVNNTGVLTIHSMNLAGPFSQTGGGTVAAQGTIATAGQAVSIAGSVTLAGSESIDTTDAGNNSGGGAINFASSIAGSSALTLNAGSSNSIVLSSAVGSSAAPLGAITIANAQNVTAAAITAQSLQQLAGTGTSDFQGAVNTTSSAGVQVAGNAITFESLVTTKNGGGATVTNSGLLTMNSMDLSGAFLQNGSGPVSASGNLTTTGKSITFDSSLTLVGGLVLDSTAGGNPSGSNINLGSTVAGANDLQLTAGSQGNITMAGAVGSVGSPIGNFTITNAANVTTAAITAASLTQTAGAGTTTFQGAIETTTSGGVDLVGNNVTITGSSSVTTLGSGGVSVTNSGLLTLNAPNMTLGGAFHQMGTGKVAASGDLATAGAPIAFTGAISLTGGLVLDATMNGSAPSGALVTVGSTIDGGQALTVSAGGGFVSFQGNIGQTANPTQLIVNSAGSGIEFGSNVTMVNVAGPIALGAVAPTGQIDFNMANSSGNLAFTMTSNNNPGDAFFVNGPVALGSNTSIDVGGGSANSVIFSINATVDSNNTSPRSLSVTAGSGGIHFNASVGVKSPLSSISAQAAGSVTVANGAVLQTKNPTGVISAGSNFPPLVRLNPPDPAKPIIVTNTTQIITGTVGGDPSQFPDDNLELGKNIILTVTWDDGTVISNQGNANPAENVIINAGDIVMLQASAGGTPVWTVKQATPGSTSGPIQIDLQYTYNFAHLVEAGPNVSAKVVVSYDPTIQLVDTAAGASTSLLQASATSRTPVAGNEFTGTQSPVAVDQAPEAAAIEQTVAQANTQDNNVFVVKPIDNPRPASEEVNKDARQFLLVQVGPDGEDLDKQYQLPDDTLQRLSELFEKFKRMRLPNGRYRIYLVEPGFPKRALREFYKSGDSIGDPPREPGPGSRNIETTPADRGAQFHPGNRAAHPSQANRSAPSQEAILHTATLADRPGLLRRFDAAPSPPQETPAAPTAVGAQSPFDKNAP